MNECKPLQLGFEQRQQQYEQRVQQQRQVQAPPASPPASLRSSAEFIHMGGSGGGGGGGGGHGAAASSTRPAPAPGPGGPPGDGPFDTERGMLQQEVKKLRAALVVSERATSAADRTAAAAEQQAEGAGLKLKVGRSIFCYEI